MERGMGKRMNSLVTLLNQIAHDLVQLLLKKRNSNPQKAAQNGQVCARLRLLKGAGPR